MVNRAPASAKLGRVLLSLVAIFWALGACAADFNDTHVFNPSWTPHARFHAAFQLVLALGMNAIALRSIWTGRPGLGASLAVIYPAAFFVVPLVPGVAFSDPGQPDHSFAGIPGQLIMGAVSIAVAGAGYGLARARGPSHWSFG